MMKSWIVLEALMLPEVIILNCLILRCENCWSSRLLFNGAWSRLEFGLDAVRS